MVVTHSGEAKPIKWIDKRSLRRHGNTLWPRQIAPVRIARSALAPDIPHTDLYVSPDHCLFLVGLLITAASLINERTIYRCPRYDAECLEYFHIELAEHDVVFAEGVPAETLLAPEHNRVFDNWPTPAELAITHGTSSNAFAPVIHIGALAQLRSRLRSAASPWVDRRRAFDIVRDRIDARALELQRAA
jgi:hypothetical protein